MWPNRQIPVDLVTFTEEILNGKLHFLCSVDRENLHIFRKTWGVSKKISENLWVMIIIKVTKLQGFTLSLLDKFLKNPQGMVKFMRTHFLQSTSDDYFYYKPCFCDTDLVIKKCKIMTKLTNAENLLQH